MNFKIPLLVLSALLVLNSDNKQSSNNTGKYIPKKQPSFKNQLDDILVNLENELKIENLRDFFMGVAWVESKFIPSAIRYETIDKDRYVDIKKLFKTNPYINNINLWSWTGGLFQLFPSTALRTADTTGINNNPVTIFDPYYSIAYAIDFASRLNKSYGAESWFDIRLGWHSLGLLKNKDPDILLEVENRIVKGINNTNGNVDILYEYNPNAFNTYRSKWKFKKLLAYLLDLKKKS